MIKKLRSKKGFTLIELLVVIAILGILVLLAAPKFLGYTKNANVATMQADAKVLSNAALIHYINNEVWPVEEDAEEYTITIGDPAVELTAEGLTENKFESSIKNIKNAFKSYAIVTEEGKYQGEVFYIGAIKEDDGTPNFEGVTDKDGDTHYGVDLVDLKDNEDDDVVIAPK